MSKFSPFLLKNILNLLLTDVDFRDRFFPILKPVHFDVGDGLLSTFVEAIWELEKQYNKFPSDDILVEEIFTNKGRNINLFSEEPSAEELESLKAFFISIYELDDVNKKYIEDNLTKILSFLAIQKVISENKDDLQTGNLDIEGFAQQIAGATTFASPLMMGKNLLADLDERTEARLKDPIIPGSVTFPIPGLASFFEGGKVPPGSLCYWMATTGGGKSMALTYIAQQAAFLDKFNVLYVTAELTEELVKQRLDACITGIPTNEVRVKASKVRDIYKKSASYSSVASRIQVLEVPMGTTTVAEINAAMDRLEKVKGFRPDLLVVDYADVLAASKHHKEFRHGLTAIYTELKELARNRNIVAWTASQFNAAGTNESLKENSNITTTHGNESGAKAHYADLIVGIARTKDELENGSARLIIVKNRIGGGVGYTLRVFPDFARARLFTGRSEAVGHTDVENKIEGLEVDDDEAEKQTQLKLVRARSFKQVYGDTEE